MADTSASLPVSGPSAVPDGGWVKYELIACTAVDSCAAPVECTAGAGTCSLALTPNTAYAVKVAAVAGTVRSLETSVDLRTLFP